MRIGLTPVFLDDQLDFLRQLNTYFERRLGLFVPLMQQHVPPLQGERCYQPVQAPFLAA